MRGGDSQRDGRGGGDFQRDGRRGGESQRDGRGCGESQKPTHKPVSSLVSLEDEQQKEFFLKHGGRRKLTPKVVL